MGVGREYFVIYGIKAKDEDFIIREYVDIENDTKNYKNVVDAVSSHECSNKYNWKKDGFKLIYLPDCYNGEYSIVGLLVSCSGQDRWGDEEDIDILLTKEEIELFDAMFKKEMEKQSIDITGYKLGLIINRHYT